MTSAGQQQKSEMKKEMDQLPMLGEACLGEAAWNV
jgi:hypothetical protein